MTASVQKSFRVALTADFNDSDGNPKFRDMGLSFGYAGKPFHLPPFRLFDDITQGLPLNLLINCDPALPVVSPAAKTSVGGCLKTPGKIPARISGLIAVGNSASVVCKNVQ